VEALQSRLAVVAQQVGSAPAIARFIGDGVMSAPLQLAHNTAQEVRVAVVPVGYQRVGEDDEAQDILRRYAGVALGRFDRQELRDAAGVLQFRFRRARDDRGLMNSPVDRFNERMSAEGNPFRLFSMLGGEVMPSAASYELRSIDAADQSQYTVCHRIADTSEETAVQVALAFVAGYDWAERVRSTPMAPQR
jgi:hypothetical protein